MQIKTIPLGPLATNCYILTGENHCVLVDPGMWPKPLLDYLRDQKLSPGQIWLTHGHGDHIAGIDLVRQKYPDAEVLCPAADADMLPDPQANLSAQFGMAMTAPAADRLIQPGQTLEIGPFSWNVLDTSGHTPGGVSYYCPQAETVLTGDALFAGSIGRSDIPRADGQRLLKNIHAHLLSLPENTRVLPGHGPASTIGLERKNNPFLR